MDWKDKRKIMQSYDVTAEMYDERYAEEQKAKYGKALKNVDVSHKIVLDIGCGSGLFFGEIAPRADMVVGIDISRKLLIKSRERARALFNVFLLQADGDHLPFTKYFFDFIFAFTVLQNMPNPYETLYEQKRVVKLDGKIVVTGLKKAFPLDKFMDILETSGLRVVNFANDKGVNCYIAVLAT
jgi:malonyl-CoA O-methyltransferase